MTDRRVHTVSTFIRSNALGLVAIFIALSGTTWAAQQIGSKRIKANAVRSKHIKNGQVKAADIKAAQVQRRVEGTCPPSQAIREVAENGDVTCAGIGGGGTPSGPAGGSLAGTYPNPQLANGAVSSAKLANGAVSSEKLANFAVTGTKLANGAVTGTKIDNFVVTEAKIAGGAVTAAKLGPIQQVRGSLTSVGAGQFGVSVATCPAGTRVISGGVGTGGARVLVTDSRRAANGWATGAINDGSAPGSVEAFAECLQG